MVGAGDGTAENDFPPVTDATPEDESATPAVALTSINISVPPTERLSRGLLFVKWLLVFPAGFVLAFYGLAVTVTTFFAFWVILFLGRYPKGLWIFARNYMELYARTYSYFPLLLTDDYPIGRWRQGAIEYDVDYPERLSRLRLLLKLVSLLLNVVSTLLSFAGSVMLLGSVVAWFAILFTGRYPEGLFRFEVALFQWILRVQGWQFLMRDEWSLFATTRRVAIPVGIGAVLSAALGVLVWVLAFAGTTTSALEVGDCFDFEFSSTTGQVTNLIFASCTGPHQAEVYATVTHDAPVGAPDPGEDALFNEAFFLCLGEFQSFVGRSYDESALDIFVHVPDSSAWTIENDRTSLCSVFRVDLEPHRGSFQGSGL